MKTGRFHAITEFERSLSWTLVFTCVAGLAFSFLLVVLTHQPQNTTVPELPPFKMEPTTTLTAKP